MSEQGTNPILTFLIILNGSQLITSSIFNMERKPEHVIKAEV